MKGQDLLMVLHLASSPEQGRRYVDLAAALCLSVSEAHQCVRRLQGAKLLFPKSQRVRHAALEEFLFHGMAYVFPANPGPRTVGVVTAHSAPPLDQLIAADDNDVLVWPHPGSRVRGFAVKPIYRSVPDVALSNAGLHEILALVDALRLGRAREVSLAARELKNRLRRAEPA